MATQLSTINLALSRLGETPVQTLGGDPRPPNVVKALAEWDQALDEALSRAPWLIATERRLIERDAAPTGGWGDWKYADRFSCPSGILKIWTVRGDGFAWERGTAVGAGGGVVHVVRANHSGPLPVELCVRRPAEAMTPMLAGAFAWDLAARLAGPIQASEEKARWAMGKAEEAYALAASSEATEIGGQDELFGMGGMQAARRFSA